MIGSRLGISWFPGELLTWNLSRPGLFISQTWDLDRLWSWNLRCTPQIKSSDKSRTRMETSRFLKSGMLHRAWKSQLNGKYKFASFRNKRSNHLKSRNSRKLLENAIKAWDFKIRIWMPRPQESPLSPLFIPSRKLKALLLKSSIPYSCCKNGYGRVLNKH